MTQQKWAFITGATSGIGRAIAFSLFQKGYSVILNGRREDRLEAIRGELLAENLGGNVLLAPIDIRDRKALEFFIHEKNSVFRDLHVIVNNAGLARGRDPLQSGVFEDWDEMIDTNLKALLTVTRLLVPYLIEKKDGHVMNLGSVAGQWAYGGGAVYCATKFGVRAITEALREDLIGTRIRVTNISPGMVETEFSEVRFRGDKQGAQKVYEGFQPLSPTDIAECVAWSLDRPRHVNIQEMIVFPTAQASIAKVHREASPK